MAPLLVILVALISVPVLIFEPEGLPRYRKLVRELRQLEEENERHVQTLKRLDAEVRELKENLSAIERIARDELGLVREGEIVFHFGD
ncbi:MAG: septum formation initiator family protein [Deltaproteobacteria bacterium]|nr:septum formation initiator family protein [Deltaproteobacteria bacterium]MDW8245594.1 septum formation initiator family protein [Sandaracinaceae bacterium]